MKAYKLVRKLKNGELAPLFINKRLRFKVGELYEAEFHPTKGFAPREGLHCCLSPFAPHLSTKERVWIEVDIEEFEYYERPESQGGKWVLANLMLVVKELTFDEVGCMLEIT